MRIVLLSEPDGDVIAREDQLGHFEADFVVAADGRVFYRHPSDSRLWFAGASAEAFRAAAAVWNLYCDEAQTCQTEAEEAAAVARLRTTLSELLKLEECPDILWVSLVEQAEDGLL